MIRILRSPTLFPFGIWAWHYMGKQTPPEVLRVALSKSKHSSIRDTAPYFTRISERKRFIDLLAYVHPKQPRCLVKALIIAQWMGARNLEYELKIGWKKTNVAHAWLVTNGKALDFEENGIRGCTELDLVSEVAIRR